MDEVAKALNLSPKQTRQGAKAISNFQGDVFALLALTREDGVNMLEEIGKLESDTEMKQEDKEMKFLELVSLDVPGSKQMYLEKIEEMKAALEKRLAKTLTEEQLRQFKALCIEPMDVQGAAEAAAD